MSSATLVSRQHHAGRDAATSPAPLGSLDVPRALLVVELDALALGLTRQLVQLERPIAHAASLVCETRAWRLEGFARRSDYARESLDRSSRWLADRAALGRALQVAPSLGDALVGADGGAPIGSVAAVEIARLLDDANGLPLVELPRWIERARRVSARQLRADARALRRALGSEARSRVAEAEAEPSSCLAGERTGHGAADLSRDEEALTKLRVEVAMPPAARAAFSEALDLFRRVAGGQASGSDFVEALLAECGCAAADDERDPAPGVAADPGHSQREGGTERTCAPNPLLDALRGSSAPLRQPAGGRAAAIATMLEDAERLTRAVSELRPGGAALDADDALVFLQELLVAETRLRVALGEVLDRLRGVCAFSSRRRSPLPFGSLGRYAEERLGMSASSAERLARLHRGTRRYGSLRQSYENGLAGEHATLTVLRLLDRSAGARAVEGDWVNAAECCTIRRLEDEARELECRDALRLGGAPALEPLPDRQWLDSCRRVPGESARRIRVLAAHALAHASERRKRLLFLDLPFESALSLEKALEDAAASQPGTSMFAAVRDPGSPPPRWVGLLVLLLEASHEWDGQAEHETPREWSRRVYARDGYRCMAPGCTSRAHLEEHHVHYRSRGGGEEPANRITLCRFHHQQGEHGGLMQVLGGAPDSLLWRLGTEGPRARWFVADRRASDRGR